MPNFKIEQIAIAPKNPELAKTLLKMIGANSWITDTVKARGLVYGEPGDNVANLHFNYDLGENLEFEILDYREGPNWVAEGEAFGSVCHLGMHVTGEELGDWFEFFHQNNIGIAQQVETQEHTNDFLIETGRKYKYVIFDTRALIGVDLKFIVRVENANRTA